MRRASLALCPLLAVALALGASDAIAETVRVHFVVQVLSATKTTPCEQPEDPVLSDRFAPPEELISGEFSYDTELLGQRQLEGPGAGIVWFKLDPAEVDLRLSIGPRVPPRLTGASISPALANDGHGDRTFSFHFQWWDHGTSQWPGGVETVALTVHVRPKNDRATARLPASLDLDGIYGSKFRMVGVPEGGLPVGKSPPWVVCGRVIAVASSSAEKQAQAQD